MSGLFGRSHKYGLPAKVRRVANLDGTPVYDNPRTIAVPASGRSYGGAEPGYWVVETFLPSGSVVEDQFLVSAEGGTVDINLCRDAQVEPQTTMATSRRFAGPMLDYKYPSAGGMFASVKKEPEYRSDADIEFFKVDTACSRLEWTDILRRDRRTWHPMKPKDVGHVAWKNEGYVLTPKDGSACRTWVEVSFGEDQRLISVPSETNGHDWTVLVGEPREEQATVRLEDDRVGPLLDYLSMGRLDAAALVLDQIENEIDGMPDTGDFFSDVVQLMGGPLQVCAAAYAATKCRNTSDWHDVVHRLAQEEWLPDGAVMAGRAALFDGSGERGWVTAAAYFRAAMDRGIPFYSLGLEYLSEGLHILADFDGGAEKDLKLVQALARRALPLEPMTTIHPR